MHRTPHQLRADALAIWQAGVEAVRSDRLVREAICVDQDLLQVADAFFPLHEIDRIVVVGGGKAAAGMAMGLEQALGDQLLRDKNVTGWLNVPADCVLPLQRIHLHAARPAGQNEPTAAAVQGTEQILRLVAGMGPRDLCLCLISGGGSALLPAPIPPITWEQKQAVTRFLSAAGANIRELNTVRKQLSRLKGGGLVAALPQGRLVSLIISDVLGDPLDLIASGPTVADASTPLDALEVLQRYQADQSESLAPILSFLKSQPSVARSSSFPHERVANFVIGNNALAVDAAGIEAERRGYSHAMNSATQLEGTAESVGIHLAQLARSMLTETGPDCLISGGEPVVQLTPIERRGKGGRNQQLVLSAMSELGLDGMQGIVLLSGGTDGEDGPTDAAGAFADQRICQTALEKKLDVSAALSRNDAYPFFHAAGGLIQTGPTHTNVCDLRVVVVSRQGDWAK